MAWVITRDLLAETTIEAYNGGVEHMPNRVGFNRMWPKPSPLTTERFRLYDDDGNCYYEGFKTPNDYTALEWGMADAGCTEMRIYNSTANEWETV